MTRKKQASLAPRPGYRPGDLEFRFHRAGCVLAIDAVRPGASWWITAAVRVPRSEPSQIGFAHERIENCSLDAARPVTTSFGTIDCDATLNVGDALFSLRTDEYLALREHLLPLGIPHIDAVVVPPAIHTNGASAQASAT